MNLFKVDNISVIKHWGDLKPLPEIITVNLTKETAWSLGTEVEATPVKKNSPTTRIRLGYDAIKDMDLKSDFEKSNEKRPDGYSHMTINEYKVSLFPFRGKLDSPFESSFKDSEISVIAGGREEETRQNSALPVQSKKHNAGARETGIITIITKEKGHAKAIARAYVDGKEAPVAIDTCSNISTIEYNDPKHNRIFKVGRRIKYSRICRKKMHQQNQEKRMIQK